MTAVRDLAPLRAIYTDAGWRWAFYFYGASVEDPMNLTGWTFSLTLAPSRVAKPSAADVHEIASGGGITLPSGECVLVELAPAAVADWAPGAYNLVLRGTDTTGRVEVLYAGSVTVARGLSQLADLGGGGLLPAGDAGAVQIFRDPASARILRGDAAQPTAVRYDAAQTLTGGQKAQARANIGAVLGVDAQPYDPDLSALAGLTSAADRLPYFTGAATAGLAVFTAFARSLMDDPDAATARATLGAVIGTDVQAYNATLAAIAGAGSAADRLTYYTGAGAATLATLTTFGRSLIDDVDAAAARTTLGLVIGTNVQAYDVELAALGGLTSAADQLPYFSGAGTAALAAFTGFGRSLVDDANAAAARVTLGLVIGTDVQAYDPELAALAGLASAADRLPYFTGSGAAALATFTAFGRSLVDDADAAAGRVTLGLGNVENKNSATLRSEITSANVTTALGFTPIDAATRGAVNGVASLGADGKLPAAQLPSVALTDTFPVASQAAMLALVAERGDVAIRTDLNRSFILATDNPGTLADWKELLTPTDAVLSVAGLTGAISAASLKSTLAIDNVENKSSATIRGEITALNVTTALTYTPTSVTGLTGVQTAAAFRTGLGLVVGTDVQAYNATLAAIAGAGSAADRLVYYTGAGAASLSTFTAFGRSLVDDADAAAARTTLGLGSMATQAASAVAITGGTISGVTSLAVAGAATFAAGVLTANAPLTISQTWNNAGVTFTGVAIDITPTAANGVSTALEVRQAGTATFTVRVGGVVTSSSDIRSFTALRGLTDAAVLSLGLNSDVVLARDAANVLALRNGANGQTLRVFNSYTDAANHEYGALRWDTNVLRIGAFAAGTGTRRVLALEGEGVTIRSLAGSVANIWQFNTAGHMLAGTDNAYDIGASGASRPRDLFLGGSLTTPVGTISAAAGVTRPLRFSTGGSVRWNVYANGTAEAGANAGSDFRISRYDDTGTYLGDLVQASRSTGALTIPNNVQIGTNAFGTTNESLTICSPVAGVGGGLTLTNPTATIGGRGSKISFNSSSTEFGRIYGVTGTDATNGSLVLQTANAGVLADVLTLDRNKLATFTGNVVAANLSVGGSGFVAFGSNAYLNSPATDAVRINNAAATASATLTVSAGNTLTTNGPIGIGASDVILARDGAGILALRNGVNPQRFHIYNSYTDASNYERTSFLWASNVFQIQTDSAGTGVARGMIIGPRDSSNLVFKTNNSGRWEIQAGGAFGAITDNTYDIGNSTNYRPRHIYAAGLLRTGGHVFSGGNLVLGFSGADGPYLQATSANAATIYNATGAAGVALTIGTLTTSGAVTLGGSLTVGGKITLPTFVNATPADGDIWFDGADHKVRQGGVTKTLTAA